MSTWAETPFAHTAPWISMALAEAAGLGLTEDQVTQLTALRDDFQRDAARITGEVRAAELELARAYRERPVDLQAVEKKIRAVADLGARLTVP